MNARRFTTSVFILGALVLGLGHNSSVADQPAPEPKRDDPAVLASRVAELEKRLAALEAAIRVEGKVVPGQIAFGDVVGNMKSERLTRYLRVNIVLSVDEKRDREVRESLLRQKIVLKNWLLAYITDQTVESMSGSKNFERMRADLLVEFDRRLSPPGQKGFVKEVLFSEWIVQ